MPSWTPASDLPERLRELREVMDWTQEDLAEAMGRAKQSANLWENGKAKPAPRRLAAMARARGWPLEIFAEGGPRPREVLGAGGYVLKAETGRFRVKGGETRPRVSQPEGTVDGVNPGLEDGAIGWLWGDEFAAKERVLDTLADWEHRIRTSNTGFDPIGLRADILDGFVAQARATGNPPPAWLIALAYDAARQARR